MTVFNNLPEAQAYARANGVIKYWRVWFTDRGTLEMRSRGGWWPNLRPAYRIYMTHAEAAEVIANRMLTSAERTEVETLWTADVSDSPNAR